MWRQDWDYKCIPCISRYFPAARRAGNHFLLCVFQTNKEGGRSHEILSAAAVVQGRRMLTRLIINSGFGNTTPTESCCFTDAAWLENGAGYLAPLETLPRPPQGRALPLGGCKYMNVDATSFCLGEPLLTLQGWANTEGAALTLPGNSRLRFCQKQKKNNSARKKTIPSFIFPWACLQLLSTTYRSQAPRDRNTNIISVPETWRLSSQVSGGKSIPAIVRAGDNSCSQAICNDVSFSSSAI